MNENIKAFLEKIAQDEEAVAKFNATRDPDEAYIMANAIQDGFTKEEFLTAMKEMEEAAKAADLSDEDLQKIAGGDTLSAAVSAAATFISGAASAASAYGALTAAAI